MGRSRAITWGLNGASSHAAIWARSFAWSAVTSGSVLACGSSARSSWIGASAGSRKGLTFQYRAGTSYFWFWFIGSKMKWNQRSASSNRWLRRRRSAMRRGAWKNVSQLYGALGAP